MTTVENHPLYRTRQGMVDRCFNSRNKNYKSYGARGITACDYLRGHPNNMLAILGKKPTPQHSIDRENNNGSYTCGSCPHCAKNGWPLNVRWATKTEQIRNRRNSVMIAKNGVTKSAKEWTDELGFGENTIYSRKRKGYRGADLIQLVNHPKYTINGESKSLREWSELSGINENTLYTRISDGATGREIIAPLKRAKCLDRHPRSTFFLELSQQTGIKVQTLRIRFKKGKRGDQLIAPLRRFTTQSNDHP